MASPPGGSTAITATSSSGWGCLQRHISQPFARLFGGAQNPSLAYQSIPTDSPDQESRREDKSTYSRNKLYRLLLIAVVIGGAGLDWYINQIYEDSKHWELRLQR